MENEESVKKEERIEGKEEEITPKKQRELEEINGTILPPGGQIRKHLITIKTNELKSKNASTKPATTRLRFYVKVDGK